MALVPLPVALPLLVATILLALAKILPPRWNDALASVTALVVAVIAGLLAAKAQDAPLVYWFGGWTPRQEVALGISFVVDQAGAAFAALVSLMFLASFIYAWGYFDEVHARFHVLMLIFLAAMAGFCLTGDLFNLFVFFELMSVVAFALTGYKLESSALEGAFHFTVTNSIAGFMMLAGIGLLYARTGALNEAQIGHALAGQGADALVILSFVLIVSALLVKAAALPFHFWIADAHAVAPTPVCVLFSGVMVPLGLFGIMRLYWTIYAGTGIEDSLVRPLFIGLGLATALVGGIAALTQRHVKRLLAFSTVSHMGVALAAVAALSASGVAGAMLYLIGHGLTKGALFMGAGILLSACGGIDELQLRGHGRRFPVTGLLFLVAAFASAGLPFGVAHEGKLLIDASLTQHGVGWMTPLLTLATALTGAALLRAAGRIFLGLGPEPGEEGAAPTEQEREKAGRPVWLMLAPALTLLAAALALDTFPLAEQASRDAALFVNQSAYAALVLKGVTPSRAVAVALPPPHYTEPLAGIGFSLLLAALELGRRHFPRSWVRFSDRLSAPLFLSLDRLHSGRVGDYVLWLVAGLVLIGGVLAA